jgi:hypothetical protein
MKEEVLKENHCLVPPEYKQHCNLTVYYQNRKFVKEKERKLLLASGEGGGGVRVL